MPRGGEFTYRGARHEPPAPRGATVQRAVAKTDVELPGHLFGARLAQFAGDDTTACAADGAVVGVPVIRVSSGFRTLLDC
jgi:hypothetical protein